MREHVEFVATRLHFLHVGVQLLQQVVIRRDHDHRHPRIDQRQRAVLESTCSVGLVVAI